MVFPRTNPAISQVDPVLVFVAGAVVGLTTGDKLVDALRELARSRARETGQAALDRFMAALQ